MDFSHVVGEGGGVVVGVVAVDEGGMAATANDDEVADLEEEAVSGVYDRLELDKYFLIRDILLLASKTLFHHRDELLIEGLNLY